MNIGDLVWVKGVASMVIKHMMVSQSTSYERKVLLNVLFDMKMLQKQGEALLFFMSNVSHFCNVYCLI